MKEAGGEIIRYEIAICRRGYVNTSGSTHGVVALRHLFADNWRCSIDRCHRLKMPGWDYLQLEPLNFRATLDPQGHVAMANRLHYRHADYDPDQLFQCVLG